MTPLRLAAAVIAFSAPGAALAQGDMMGFDLIALLSALPKLILHAAAEFTVALIAVATLLGIASWLVARFAKSAGAWRNRLPIAFTVASVLILVVLYVASIVPPDANRGRPQVAALKAPNGKPWPKKTGYLDMPQSPPAGASAIKVTHGSSAGRVYVKLCVAREAACPGLRHALIEKFGEFEFRGLAEGEYEIRSISIDRPTTAGRSRSVAVSPASADVPVVRLPFSPVRDSKDFVYGVPVEAF